MIGQLTKNFWVVLAASVFVAVSFISEIAVSIFTKNGSFRVAVFQNIPG